MSQLKAKNNNKALGSAGEAATVTFLKEQGYQVIATNYRTRQGEVDIIAENKDTRLFVEVKTRTTDYFDTSTLITNKKQRSIIKAALDFNLKTHWPSYKNSRFDVALLNKKGVDFAIRYIPNAFTVSSEAFI